ncbi:MAG: hypothetical protein ACREBR_05025 [bacterium]
MRFKVFIPDNPRITGGWMKVGTIEAENEAAALVAAKAKHGERIMLKIIKNDPPIQETPNV